MSTVLVAANASDADPGYVGERLVARGFALRTVLRDDAEIPTSVPDDVAVVLLLGSAWSVVDPVRPDVLAAETALVRSAHRTGTPVLGLCYGAQVVTHALGGRVDLLPTPEVGLVTVDSDDPDLVPTGPWWEFHTDNVTPPAQARVVARNACGVQAYTLPGIVAVQFHPEVRPSTFEDWLRRYPELADAAGADAGALIAQARDREDDARRAASALVDAFLATTAQPSAAASSSASP